MVRYGLLLLCLSLSTRQTISAIKLPLIVTGPVGSNEINHDLVFDSKVALASEHRPIIENIKIESNITRQYEKTTVKCFVKNPSIRKSHEIGFTIELPSHNYDITNITLRILGDEIVYLGQHMNGDEVEAIYQKTSKKDQSTVMVKELKKGPLNAPRLLNLTPGARMISMNTYIPPGEKILLTLEYAGRLMKSQNNSYGYTLHINPHQTIQDYSINVYVNETLPILDPEAYEDRDGHFSNANIKYDQPEHLYISFLPKTGTNQPKIVGGYDMSGKFYLSYALNKNELLSKVGQGIADIASDVEFDKMVTGIENVVIGILDFLDFMFKTFFVLPFMLPFMMITEVFNGFFLMTDVLRGKDTDWVLEKPWYELEFDSWNDKFDGSFQEFEKEDDRLKNTFGGLGHFQYDDFDTLLTSASKLPRVDDWSPFGQEFWMY